jgi:hypothetical protein
MSNIKFANAKQVKEIYLYKNIRTKLHKTKPAIWYNKKDSALVGQVLYLDIFCINLQLYW